MHEQSRLLPRSPLPAVDCVRSPILGTVAGEAGGRPRVGGAAPGQDAGALYSSLAGPSAKHLPLTSCRQHIQDAVEYLTHTDRLPSVPHSRNYSVRQTIKSRAASAFPDTINVIN